MFLQGHSDLRWISTPWPVFTQYALLPNSDLKVTQSPSKMDSNGINIKRFRSLPEKWLFWFYFVNNHTPTVLGPPWRPKTSLKICLFLFILQNVWIWGAPGEAAYPLCFAWCTLWAQRVSPGSPRAGFQRFWNGFVHILNPRGCFFGGFGIDLCTTRCPKSARVPCEKLPRNPRRKQTGKL